jgi:hypothetical protein
MQKSKCKIAVSAEGGQILLVYEFLRSKNSFHNFSF